MDLHHEPIEQEIEFTTPCKLILQLDEIHYGPDSDRKVALDAVGGAGTFSIIGARIFSPPSLSYKLGWIVDAGHDFPLQCRTLLESLSTNLLLRDDSNRCTTRGWNSYGVGDHRAFRYATPKKRLDVDDLTSAGFATAKCVHLICSPKRASRIHAEISQKARASSTTSSQILIWEPVPDVCLPAYREQMLEATRLVGVFSPNAGELVGFFSDQKDVGSPDDKVNIEFLASKILESGVGFDSRGTIVVRCGKNGCLLMAKGHNTTWLPAYYDETPQKQDTKIIDPTGCGNAFIGGLAVGLVRHDGHALLAATLGTVAASFVIEQIGIPIHSEDIDGKELWNGLEVLDRLDEYWYRLNKAGITLQSWGR